MVTGVKMQAEEYNRVELYYAKSAAVEIYEMNLSMERPRHQVLSPPRCPEDSMGGT